MTTDESFLLDRRKQKTTRILNPMGKHQQSGERRYDFLQREMEAGSQKDSPALGLQRPAQRLRNRNQGLRLQLEGRRRLLGHHRRHKEEPRQHRRDEEGFQ